MGNRFGSLLIPFSQFSAGVYLDLASIVGDALDLFIPVGAVVSGNNIWPWLLVLKPS